MEDVFHLGIKALIRNEKGQVLVLKVNTKDFSKPVKEHWDLPGGRIHKGETIKKALLRELEEEIGVKKVRILKLLDASLSKIRITYMDAGLILFTYLCTIDKNQKIKLTDQEHIEYQWLTPKKAAKSLKNKFSDSLIEILNKLK